MLTPLAHPRLPIDRTLPMTKLLILSVLATLPRFRVLALELMLVPPPERPGVTLVSPTVRTPAVIVVVCANEQVA